MAGWASVRQGLFDIRKAVDVGPDLPPCENRLHPDLVQQGLQFFDPDTAHVGDTSNRGEMCSEGCDALGKEARDRDVRAGAGDFMGSERRLLRVTIHEFPPGIDTELQG